jgi:inosine/xanthosine triphosphatase
MKINVGSANPVKINAARDAFLHFCREARVTGIEVDAGVSEMPMTDEECIKGAVNRAKKAIGDGDYGVGLEGGVDDTEHGMFLTGWAAVVSKDGWIGLGNSGKLLLPEIIAKRIREGEELGPVMDEVTGIANVKRNKGAIGFFTDNVMDRTKSFENSIVLAMARFVKEDMYV